MRVMSDLGYEELWGFFLFVFFSQVLFSCCISMYKTSEVPQNSEISLSKSQGVCFFYSTLYFQMSVKILLKKRLSGECVCEGLTNSV